MTPAEIAQALTELYRTPTGTMTLRPLQGVALLGMSPGLFTNMSVGLGKAEPNSEPVLTTQGWRPIGDLRPGDFVIGSAGTPVRVLSVHPQGVRPVMRVAFTDGSWTRCDTEHLWTFRNAKLRKTRSRKVTGLPQRGAGSDELGSMWQTKTLTEWLEVGVDRKCGGGRAHTLFLPMVRPVQYPEQDLPLDPYTLGALLGDGCMTKNLSFVSMDEDIVTSLVLPKGVILKKTASQCSGLATQFNITAGYQTRVANPLKEILKSLGLHGCNSETKFVPGIYLRASAQQRLDLLQGLFDTDGHLCNEGGGIEYSTLSSRLAMDVTELVESLGGTASHNEDAANGNARIYVKLPRHLAPFRCKRKGEPYFAAHKRQREPYRALEAVTPDGFEECTCITVDAWDSLYVTRHHILTHNSLTIAIAMTIAGGARPMILTESSNIPQMRADFERYRLHFQIPTYYRLEAYNILSVEKSATLLEDVRPTFLALDEAQNVRPGGPRWKRIERWRKVAPEAPVLALSGSPGRSLAVYAHLMVWAVPALASTNGGPIPVDDEGVPDGPEFREWVGELAVDDSKHERVWSTIKSTPGVVISSETYTDTPLVIRHNVLPTPPEMIPHWERLRTYGEAPDGWATEQGGLGEQWLLARCMSNGLYYEHDPRPSLEYLEIRKEWVRQVNRTIDDGYAMAGGPYDTPGQVARGVLSGKLPREAFDRWMAIKPTYNPITRTTWLSRAALEWAAAWGEGVAIRATRKSGGGIVWVAQTGFGEELSRMTKWAFYSDGARNAKRQHVSLADAPGTPSIIICSINSCGTGKNLQHRFSRALFMSPPSNNDAAEQYIGREHRHEQSEPLVEVDLLFGCLEDWSGWYKAEAEARDAEEDLTAQRKILLARHERCSYPGSDDAGPAWTKATPVVVTID